MQDSSFLLYNHSLSQSILVHQGKRKKGETGKETRREKERAKGERGSERERERNFTYKISIQPLARPFFL